MAVNGTFAGIPGPGAVQMSFLQGADADGPAPCIKGGWSICTVRWNTCAKTEADLGVYTLQFV